MDFFINNNATLPILKMELIQDGRYDMSEFFNKLQNSDIYFNMYRIDDGVKIIGKKLTSAISKETCFDQDECISDEYYLTYTFTERDTKTPGIYVANFSLTFLDGSGTLIVPIREELRVNILSGSIKN